MDRENLIDFPCAPDWVKHYADQGITPDYPPGYYQRTNPDEVREQIDKSVTEILERVEERLNLYQGQLIYLQNKILEKPKYKQVEQKRSKGTIEI